MLTELTKPQEKQLDIVIKEWIELITSGKIIVTEEDIRKDIDWLYKEANLSPPKIVMAKNLKQHKRQVRDAQQKNTFKFVQQEFGLGFESWLCLYEFLENIDYTHNKKYLRYTNLMKKGIFSAVFTDKMAFICQLPSKIRFNDDERLHSIAKPAIQMPNRDNYYFIKGTKFDEKLWKKLSKRTLTGKELMKIKNMEQRYIAFEMYGPEKLLKEYNSKILDTYDSTSKNLGKSIKIELHEIPNLIENTSVKMLTYKCHSTARPYFSFVPPETKTAIDAMAWKFQVTPDEYAKIDIQS